MAGLIVSAAAVLCSGSVGVGVGRHFPCKLAGHAPTPPPAPERPRWEPEPEPEAVCGCAHSLAFHDEKGCHHPDPQYVVRLGPFQRTADCACRRYVGPEPLPRVIT